MRAVGDGMMLGPTAAAAIRLLHAGGPVTRAELTTRLGVSPPTAGEAIGELVSAGLARYGAAPRAGRGRPSPMVSPVPVGCGAVAVTLAVSSLQVALVGLGGTVLAVRRTEWTLGPPDPHDAITEIERHVKELFAHRPDVMGRCVGAGAAVYGLVRADRSTVSAAPNLGWWDVPLGTALRERLGLPVVVVNNSHAGAFAEYRRGAGAGARHLLYLTGEVGIGGAFVVDGRLLVGEHGFSGEVGHLMVNPGGRQCHCGNRGCWETEIDRRALLRHAGRADRRGRQIVDESDRILAAATAGQQAARGAVAGLVPWLGFGLVNLLHTLDPQRIVWANFLAGLLPLVHDQVRDLLREHSVDRAAPLPELVPAELREHVEIIGAAELAFEQFLTTSPQEVP